jgi:hypothetical protein
VNSDENHDDLELDDEDHLAVSALTQDDIAAIDSAILAEARVHWQKVAMVVAKAMDAYPGEYLEIPDLFYGQRVRELVLAGRLVSQGNVSRMRFSEVRLPSPDENVA